MPTGWKIIGKKKTVKYNANKKVWMNMIVFPEFLTALDIPMGVKSRKILLFVDNCAAHLQDSSFLSNVKVISCKR
jgi:hypothetical protein